MHVCIRGPKIGAWSLPLPFSSSSLSQEIVLPWLRRKGRRKGWGDRVKVVRDGEIKAAERIASQVVRKKKISFPTRSNHHPQFPTKLYL